MVNLDSPNGTENGSEQRSGLVKQYTIMHDSLIRQYSALTNRTYEQPYQWYYIVFKPFNDSYGPSYDNCIGKLYDWIRPKSCCSIITKEIFAKKIHANALCVSDKDLLLMDGTNIQKRGLKYKISVTYIEGRAHRENVLKYMFKEALEREFKIYSDYTHHSSDVQWSDSTSSDKSSEESPPSVSNDSGVCSDDPHEPFTYKRNIFNICNNNKLKLA